MSDEIDLTLHKAVYRGEKDTVKKLLDKSNPENKLDCMNLKDHEGNYPIHIAAHFADLEIVELLLNAGCDPEPLSTAGWRPLEEAIATGSRPVAHRLMKASLQKYRDDMHKNAKIWHERLEQMPDFTMELQWEFKVMGGWIPFVSDYLPNDVYRISKRGSAIRFDYSLVGFKSLKIIRGDMSLLFTSKTHEPPGHLFAINHNEKTRQDFCAPPGGNYDADIDQALNYLLAHDNCSHMPLGFDGEVEHEIEFKPVYGWFSSSQKKDNIQGYDALVYKTHGAQFRSLIRSDPDAKQTRIPRSLQSKDLFQAHREAFDDYFSKDKERSTPNGLVWETENVRRRVKTFEGHLYMAKDFPLTTKEFLSLVEIYSPTNPIWKTLQDFLTMKFPEGYPIKIEIPVYYLITAEIQCKEYREESPDESLFELPKEYREVNEAYIGSETREMFKTVESKTANPSKGKEEPKEEEVVQAAPKEEEAHEEAHEETDKKKKKKKKKKNKANN